MKDVVNEEKARNVRSRRMGVRFFDYVKEVLLKLAGPTSKNRLLAFQNRPFRVLVIFSRIFPLLSRARVARFYLVQLTKIGEYQNTTIYVPNGHKIYLMAHKIYQMAIKYTKWP
jgi:hypothetical protein